MTTDWLESSYDAFPRVEEAFHAALEESLHPRGPELLYDLVADLELAAGSRAVDVGCGEGGHTLQLALRFGLDVLGIDPVPRHIELATASAGERRVRYELGSAEALPLEDASVELVWCRDVLVHVVDLDRVYAEFERVLRPGGHAVVYQMFATDRLEPREAEWFFRTTGIVPASADPVRTEDAIARAALRVERCVPIGSEWGELAEEESGKPGRRLLWAARLLREPERYTAQFGEDAYAIMLGDCLWHVYAMIGKLERRAYVLSKP
ncbi:MAG TPA: class I SAM-dependent methyltransferase [Gaiellaceae bacterium]